MYLLLSGNLHLKPHNHICITVEFLADLRMWNSFLSHPSAFARPFIDFNEIVEVTDIAFFMDASKNFGGICFNKHWMRERWPKEFAKVDPSIQYLELFAQTAGNLAWGNHLANKCILVHCDNSSVVYMINNSSSSCCNCMVLIRILTHFSMINNIRVFTRHL